MGWKVCDKWKEHPVNKQRDALKALHCLAPVIYLLHCCFFDTTPNFFLKHSLFTGMNTNFTNKIFLMLHFYLLFPVSSPPIFQVLSHSTFSPKPSLLSSFLETLLHFLVMECMFQSLFLILSSHVLDYDLFLISFFL